MKTYDFDMEIVNGNKVFNMDLSLENDTKAFDMGMGVVTEGGGGTGGTTNYNDLANKPSINSVILKGNKTSEELKLYGENNEPPYPVTSVNGMTGDIIVPTGGGSGAVNSVNGQIGDVVLTAKDVNALPDTTVIPTELSQLDNDENFITETALNDYAKSADVVEKTDITQTLDNSTDKVPSAKAVSDAITSAGGGDMMKAVYDPNNTVADAGGIVNYVNANGGKIDIVKVNNVAQEITDKAVNIAVPTDNADLTNGANYITSAQAPVQSVNGQTGNVNIAIPDEPTKLSQLENDTGFITDKALDGYAKSNEIPTNNNQLINGAGYITSDALSPYAKSVDLPTNTSELVNDSGYITESALTPYAKTADIPEYNIVKAEIAQDGYFATYYLAKDGVNLSTAINIPKDYLVKTADIKTSTGDTDPSGLPEGTKYIDFVVNTYVDSGTESHIYLNVNELVDAYTAGDGIEISENNIISAKVVSVNGKIGNVNLTYSDVGALSADTAIPTMTSELTNDSNFAIQDGSLDTNKAIISNSDGKLTTSDVTSTELGYLSGVTSNVQSQLIALGRAKIEKYVRPASVSLKTGQQLIIYAAVGTDVTITLGKASYTFNIADSKACFWALWIKTDDLAGSFILPSGIRNYMYSELQLSDDENTFNLSYTTDRSVVIIVLG